MTQHQITKTVKGQGCKATMTVTWDDDAPFVAETIIHAYTEVRNEHHAQTNRQR